ncbi:hypothetical protein [Paenarthrobacter sp. NPDC058040]|uniref:hypothetical protein n=1 Tax=unclassified Paenarthrobacter TaxID=2634190 RepID=UPI0036DA72F4
MKLQAAIDLLSTEAALELAGKVARYVDIIGGPNRRWQRISARPSCGGLPPEAGTVC